MEQVRESTAETKQKYGVIDRFFFIIFFLLLVLRDANHGTMVQIPFPFADPSTNLAISSQDKTLIPNSTLDRFLVIFIFSHRIETLNQQSVALKVTLRSNNINH